MRISTKASRLERLQAPGPYSARLGRPHTGHGSVDFAKVPVWFIPTQKGPRSDLRPRGAFCRKHILCA